MKVLNLSGDLSDAVSLCMEVEANMRAARFARSLAKSKVMADAWCIYVIGPSEIEEINKIGVSNDPINRLATLQIGNWHRLEVRALAWVGRFRLTREIYEIETLAHKAAAEMGISIGGEWVNATPRDACELALKAIRYYGSSALDSATYLDSLADRTVRAAEAKGLVETA